jgi:hypothetical protein
MLQALETILRAPAIFFLHLYFTEKRKSKPAYLTPNFSANGDWQ